MRIYIASPGQFYEGFNSRIRGEGRWLIHLAGVLRTQGHDVTVFSNDPLGVYTDRGVTFTSVWNDAYPKECDLMISMDAFSDLPQLHKTNVTPQVDTFKPTKRVWATVFPVEDTHPVHDVLPVIYMYNFGRQKGIPLPLLTHDKVVPPDFTKTKFHWYSKNANEEPQYILGAMRGIARLVENHGASGTFIDGPQLFQGDYRKNYPKEKEQETKQLFSSILSKGSESFANWVPYDYALSLLSKSKLLLGVHHPIMAPSILEVVVLGGFPVIFENQKNCPPYDHVDIPYVKENASDDEVADFIEMMWTDKDLFEASVLTCQEAIHAHSYPEVYKAVQKFIYDL